MVMTCWRRLEETVEHSRVDTVLGTGTEGQSSHQCSLAPLGDKRASWAETTSRSLLTPSLCSSLWFSLSPPTSPMVVPSSSV